MNFLELFRVAISALLANRLRSVLTMLGIIIGVGAVLALVSFGQGFQNYVNQSVQSFGTNQLTINKTNPNGPNAKLLKSKSLTIDDATAIANPTNVTGLAGVSPEFTASANISANGNTSTASITGVTADWLIVRDRVLKQGRFIEQADIDAKERVAVIGTTTTTDLFGEGTDPIGQEVQIGNATFTVIGLLQTSGGTGFNDPDDVIAVPISTAQTRLSRSSAQTSTGEYIVSSITVKTVNSDVIPTVKAQITDVLSQRHEIQFKGEEDFSLFSSDTIISSVNSVLSLITVFLGVIAGISLFVGGIGVMNIMLVTVTERTREIGLRKAVGARYLDLTIQFLIESVLLCVIGGIFGIMVGMLAAYIATKAIPTLTLTVTIPSMLMATGVSTAIGIFFGLYPASRAASLSPIEALHYE
jgi:putative ABC transport system permease protein